MNKTQIEIKYKPAYIKKILKQILEVLRSFLSEKQFKFLFNFLYNLMNKIIRLIYLFKVIYIYFLSTDENKNKYLLTFKLLPYTMGGPKAIENAFVVTRIIDNNNIEGCIIECGVAKGGASAMMILTNHMFHNKKRSLLLFDSFEGLPNPTEEDFVGEKSGDYVQSLDQGDCLGTVEQVSNLFKSLKIDYSKVKYIKGWFQNTIPDYALDEKIAILRLDGDWYESTKIPLEKFYDYISIGGAIIVDDYGTCFGSKKAVNEFIQSRNLDIDLHPDGRGGAWFLKKS